MMKENGEKSKKEEEMKKEKKRDEYNAKIDAFIQKNGPYWRYEEADTYIEIKKYSGVPSIDKANQIRAYFMGNDNELSVMHTLVYSHQVPYTIDEYHKEFCEKKNYNGKEIWVYKGY